MADRSYADPCGVARALDHIGERWALLIVRELLLGPKRFTDLRAALSGASPNVLSQRLVELERSGVIERHRLAPPAGAWVYQLTERGRGLEDVVSALARWGGSTLPVPKGDLSADAMMLALRTTYDAPPASDLAGRFEIQLPDATYTVTVRSRRLDVRRGPATNPDATVIATTKAVTRVLFGGLPLDEALQTGGLRITGDRRLVERLLRSFRNPLRAS